MANSEYNFPISQFSLISGSITNPEFNPLDTNTGHFVQLSVLNYPSADNLLNRVRSNEYLDTEQLQRKLNV